MRKREKERTWNEHRHFGLRPLSPRQHLKLKMIAHLGSCLFIYCVRRAFGKETFDETFNDKEVVPVEAHHKEERAYRTQAHLSKMITCHLFTPQQMERGTERDREGEREKKTITTATTQQSLETRESVSFLCLYFYFIIWPIIFMACWNQYYGIYRYLSLQITTFTSIILV